MSKSRPDMVVTTKRTFFISFIWNEDESVRVASPAYITITKNSAKIAKRRLSKANEKL
jgi:hypothetical protein